VGLKCVLATIFNLAAFQLVRECDHMIYENGQGV